MLFYLTMIFACQLAGELLTVALALPVPGPVCGMALLFAGLLLRGGIPSDLGAMAGALLDNLSLLFVPAGVGVMLHVGLLSRDWLAISIALVVSTAVTIAVTALLMSWLSRRSGAADPAGDR